jgi:hypothetical protein
MFLLQQTYFYHLIYFSSILDLFTLIKPIQQNMDDSAAAEEMAATQNAEDQKQTKELEVCFCFQE